MDYHAKLPKDNHNVSHESPFKEFLTLLGGLAIVVLLIYWVSGFFIDAAVDNISPEMENAIFDTIGQDLIIPETEKPSKEYVILEQKMAVLVDEMSSCIDVGYPIKLIFQHSEQANAFAAPGGNMVVLSGLLKYVKSENGLAFVIAHELGHFKHRDHLRGLGRGVVLMAMSFFATGNAQLSSVLTPLNTFQSAQFSQGRESDADEIALDIVQCHYGHVGGATEFFERIAEKTRTVPFVHYFDSHPEAKKRVAAIKTMSEQKGYLSGEVKPAFWSYKKVKTE